MAVDCYQKCCCYSNNLMPRSPWRQQGRKEGFSMETVDELTWLAGRLRHGPHIQHRGFQGRWHRSLLSVLKAVLTGPVWTLQGSPYSFSSWIVCGRLPDVSSHDCRLLLYFQTHLAVSSLEPRYWCTDLEWIRTFRMYFFYAFTIIRLVSEPWKQVKIFQIILRSIYVHFQCKIL